MTTTEKIRKAERWRIKTGKMGSDETDGWNGCFLVPLDGEIYNVMISDGYGWRHLSATNGQRKELPSWQVMVRLKECFFADDEWAAIYVPAKEEYVNDHPFVHHVWSPLNEVLPKPPVVLV